MDNIDNCKICGGSIRFISGEYIKCEYCGQIYNIDGEEVSNEHIYIKATELFRSNSADKNNEAYELFDSILTYRDSATKAQECLTNIENLEVLEEEKRLKERRQREIDAKKNEELEENDRKKKKIWNIVLVCAGIVCAIMIVIFMSNQNALEKKYGNALSLLQDGQVEESLEIFKSLDGFKDSERYVTNLTNKVIEYETSYNAAIELYNATDYENALLMFVNHIKYKDSLQYINSCAKEVYHQAENLFSTNNLEVAKQKLDTIPDCAEVYQSAKELTIKIEDAITLEYYSRAVALYNESNYIEAQKILLDIRNFEDSSIYIEKIGNNIFLKAKQVYEASDYVQCYELLKYINEKGEWSNCTEAEELSIEVTSKYKNEIEGKALDILSKSGYEDFLNYLNDSVNELYKKEDVEILVSMHSPVNLMDLEMIGGWANIVTDTLYSSRDSEEGEDKYTDNHGNEYGWGMNYRSGSSGGMKEEIVYAEYFVKEYSYFSGIAIMNYEFMTWENGGFVTVWGDDKLLYSSSEVKKGHNTEKIYIDISQVDILRIELSGAYMTLSIAEPYLIR